MDSSVAVALDQTAGVLVNLTGQIFTIDSAVVRKQQSVARIKAYYHMTSRLGVK